MSFLGMDTEGARAHAQRLDRAARSVDGMQEAIGAAVDGAAWQGPDAAGFREQWHAIASAQIARAAQRLSAVAADLHTQAEEQDRVSEESDGGAGEPQGPPQGRPVPPHPGAGGIPPSPAGDRDDGYLREDNPWLPDWLEAPLEQGLSSLAGAVSDELGDLVDGGLDMLSGIGRDLGLRMDGIDQFHRDASHWGGIWRDLLTGERVPTISELAAGGVVALLSGGAGLHEAATGQDTPFMDDRPGGQVHSVTTTPGGQALQTLQDLILQNNGLRMGPEAGDTPTSGQIGIQKVRPAGGGEAVYIVQVPPTEGDVGSLDSYGAQGNSRDWASNLRLVSGGHPAAMDDVQAAMAAPGPDGRPAVPPGARVMFVGHSQGGIITSHLAADPAFNNTSGQPGTYNVTHSFSVGSPVQTVLPAQAGTEVVNVSHGPVQVDAPDSTGDPIAHADLQGRQMTGGRLQAPNLHEVILPGPSARTGMPWLTQNHDSVGYRRDGSVDPDGGYAGTVGRSTFTEPTLSALQRDITGTYIGPGTRVVDTTVVDVGREDRQ